jgi:DNA adenine methylase
VKPIVKWAGGKSRLLDELRKRVPTDVRTYVEPFAGGAALFFALAEDVAAHKRTMARAILADRNDELIACYRAVKNDVKGVIHALGAYRYDKELFYEVRARDTSTMTDVERGARLIFLNHTCFNGLWRVNASGKFNVPFGKYKNPRILDEDGLVAASAAFENVEFACGDFTEVTRDLGQGDFVYFDPPYVPVSSTADFTSYAAGGFGPSDQTRLVEELTRLRDAGVLGMLSNADTPDTRELYADFNVASVSAPRSINSDVSRRGMAAELLVTTWGMKDAARPKRAGRERARA